MARLGLSRELRAMIVGASLAWMTAGAIQDYQGMGRSAEIALLQVR